MLGLVGLWLRALSLLRSWCACCLRSFEYPYLLVYLKKPFVIPKQCGAKIFVLFCANFNQPLRFFLPGCYLLGDAIHQPIEVLLQVFLPLNDFGFR